MLFICFQLCVSVWLWHESHQMAGSVNWEHGQPDMQFFYVLGFLSRQVDEFIIEYSLTFE